MNHAVIHGRLGRDAEAKNTSTGKAMTRLNIGSSVGWGDKKQTLWMQVTVFGKTAEFAAKLSKGDEVIVSGRLEPNVWTDKNGVERKDIVMTADTVDRVGGKRDGGERQPEREPDVPRAEPRGGAAAGGYDDEDIPF